MLGYPPYLAPRTRSLHGISSNLRSPPATEPQVIAVGLQKSLKALSRHFPQLLRELYNLWVETTLLFCVQSPSDGPPDSLWTWKIFDIPKKTSFDSRPIAIGSLLLRTWHKSLLNILPLVPHGQFCGRSKTSVATATASYLSSRPHHVAGTDLSKAFDSLVPELVETALHSPGCAEACCSHVNKSLARPSHLHG